MIRALFRWLFGEPSPARSGRKFTPAEDAQVVVVDFEKAARIDAVSRRVAEAVLLLAKGELGPTQAAHVADECDAAAAELRADEPLHPDDAEVLETLEDVGRKLGHYASTRNR